MNLTDQVTSVETSRALQAAGVDCHSGLVWYIDRGGFAGIDLRGFDESDDCPFEIIPAWTAVELQDGTGINVRQYQHPAGDHRWCASNRKGNKRPIKYHDNPAEAAAALILEARDE